MYNDMILNSNALWLILQKGMCLIFHQNLIHSGGRFRIGLKDKILTDLRLFCYLWTELKNS